VSLSGRAGGMLAAAVLALLLYAGALGGPFLYDDVVEIQENPRVHSLSRVPGLLTTDFWNAGKGRNPLYRPLTAVVMTTTWVLGGGSPFLHHLVNALLHAAASALVVAVVHALTGRAAGSLIAGLLFAAHPVHSEAVAWISGLAEPLSCVFVLGAWLAHARGRFALAAALLAPGLLAKEGAVVFLGLALLGDWMLAGHARIRWRAHGAYVLVTAGYLALRLAVLGHIFGGLSQGPPLLNPLRDLPSVDRMLTSVIVIGTAVRQSLAPVTLCLDYGYNQIPRVSGLLDTRLLGWGAALIAAGGAALFAWKSAGPAQRSAAAGAAILLGSFLPASNLLFPGISTFAERNLYLPVLGVCLAAGMALDAFGWNGRGSGRRFAAMGAVALLVGAAGARTWARHDDFSSKLALFGSAAQACPGSARAHLFHGIALRENGHVPEAMEAQRAALAIAPQSNDAHSELGLGMMLSGDLAGAEREFNEALRLNAEDREARSNLSSLYAQTGRLGQALAEGSEAVRLFPDDPEVLNNHASNLVDAGRLEEARAIFERLIRTAPESPAGPNGMGAILAREGRWPEAAVRFEEALQRKAGDLNATLNLAQALSQSGEPRRALDVLDRALASGMDDPDLRAMRARLAAQSPSAR
jgi:Flp pilus assembly protein TadD